MASPCCSWKLVLPLFLLSAVPLAIIMSLENSNPGTHLFEYHSTGWFRECVVWDDLSRRFIVSFMEGGLGEIHVPEDYSPGDVLREIPVVKEADLAGNASLGMRIDRPRNRVLVVSCDLLGHRYSALAAYDLSTWKRLFLTQLSGSGDGKTFADDVAIDAEGNAYVTDAKANKIWKVDVNGEFQYNIRSPLFTPKEWYKNLVGLNGIVYHPNGYLIVVHTFSGNLFKINLRNGDDEVKLINVVGPLTFGDGIAILSPTKIVVAGNPSKMVESSDDWETATIVGKFMGPVHRITTAATVKEDKVYVSLLLGMGYPRRKHVLAEAVFA